MNDSPVSAGVQEEELLKGYGLHSIWQNRSGRSGGGIARSSSAKVESHSSSSFSGRDACKIVATKGNLNNDKRPIYIIAVYIPPGLRVRAKEKYLESIRCLINKIKTEARNPMIFMAGDFNKYDLTPALEDFLDMQCFLSPPTRGDERLVLIVSNIADNIDCEILPPLDNDQGAPSDHKILGARLLLQHSDQFTWVKYRTRQITKKNHEEFARRYCGINWEDEFKNVECPSWMAAKLHEITNMLTEECFPWKYRKIRSTDDPWITDEIRRAIRRRKRKFKKYRKTKPWRIVKEETEKLIRDAKMEFYEKAVGELKQQGANKIPCAILKEIAIPDRPRPWSINKVDPNSRDIG